MSYWTLRIGLAFIAVGLLLLSPAADFLPVDFWLWVKSLFLPGSSSSSEHVYMRVVPGQPSRLFEFVLIGVGFLLVAAALYFRPNE
jgi:hypothetical protein